MGAVRVLLGVLSIVLIVGVLWDAFETIVLPRRVVRRVRFARLFFITLWGVWTARLHKAATISARAENYLSYYGPLSLIVLLAVWAFALILGFGTLQWACGTVLIAHDSPDAFGTFLYMSGTTFFTLGLGDVAPLTAVGRWLVVLEAGTGFGFLALVIGYLPVLYQAFSRRESDITLLDARAGSPPTAFELLRRASRERREGGDDEVSALLHDWERWCAELLESHLSYRVLAYFRSQHDNQSWVAALTTILDACALVMVGIDGIPRRQAQLTFAIARHAAVDLSQILDVAPVEHAARLTDTDLALLRRALAGADAALRDGDDADDRLTELRELYEPYVVALASWLLMPLPPWLPEGYHPDDWETTAFPIEANEAVRHFT